LVDQGVDLVDPNVLYLCRSIAGAKVELLLAPLYVLFLVILMHGRLFWILHYNFILLGKFD